ncbi:MAG: putative DNA-directed DNA polymerase [Promethearchaeota archaeon]|nr:MAG: putative DNA-directed DNA polymerase [Candidatus Lokiarchaeota archaeon]
MSYTLLHHHDDMSHLDGFGKPERHAKRASEVGVKALAVTNHGNMYSHLSHIKACKKHKIKPILGNELYVYHQPCDVRNNTNRWNSHMVVWAKNYQGWKRLAKLTSYTNDPKFFYYKPRIYPWNTDSVYGLEHFLDGNIQGFSGHTGSHLSDILYCDLYSDNPKEEREKIRKAYAQRNISDPDYYKRFLKDNWLDSACELALKFEKMFGKGNFFIELQNECYESDERPLWFQISAVECLRKVAKETGIPAVASSDPHYAYPEDSKDQRAMVMVQMKETYESVRKKLNDPENTDVFVFFGSDSFFIHSYEDMKKKFTQEELDNTNKIGDNIEEYDLEQKPYFPKIQVPVVKDNKVYTTCNNEYDRYLMHLCIEGAKRKQPWTSSKCSKQDYWDRLLSETEIMFKYGLSKYFIVVWDICMAADNRPKNRNFDWKANLKINGKIDPIPRGPGRGSAGSSLISYLLNITKLDPMSHDLMLARFMNAGRFTEDHISLPDIDLDFGVEGREWIIDYLRDKYGSQYCSQIVTFQRIQGRAAIKDLIRINGIPNGAQIANEITKLIPPEAEIADEIQEMHDAGHEDYGIINWAIDNIADFADVYNDDRYKEIIDQAIRCEGTIRGSGKHPAGIVITPETVDEIFPLTYDTKSKQQIIGMDMKDAEKLGGIKFDILGIVLLDKLKMIERLVNDSSGQ